MKTIDANKPCIGHPGYSEMTCMSTGGLLAAFFTGVNNSRLRGQTDELTKVINEGDFAYCIDATWFYPTGQVYISDQGVVYCDYRHRD